MAELNGSLLSSAGLDQIAVERAVAELRGGRAVALTGQGSLVLVAGIELLEAPTSAALDALAKGRARLVLSTPRLRRLGLDRSEPGAVALPRIDMERISLLALRLDARIDAPVAALSALEVAAAELARIALLLPAVIVVPLQPGQVIPDSVLSVTAAAVLGYRHERVIDLRIVGRAPVPLEGAPDAEFVIFRGGEGLRDQVAIIIGKPDFGRPVTVRLHSACLTGDLFGSLKCDCGDQLRYAVRYMAENGGGVLLYLDQEGRGNGLANKIRAYKLQSEGLDTYDSDEVLGFDQDGRRFDFAAVMLKQLGLERVRVLTNNPAKLAALGASGLEVVSEQRIFGRQTEQNISYLASKRDRAGQLLDIDEVPSHGDAGD